MSWTSFIIYLSIGYLVYYAINLLADLVLSPKIDQAIPPPVYQIDLPDPIDASEILDTNQADPNQVFLNCEDLDASGALRMDELFEQVAKGTIEYTAKLSF